MKYGFKWTAVSILVAVAGSIACSSSEGTGEVAERSREPLGHDSLGNETPSHEAPVVPGEPGAPAAATKDADPSCGQLGQPCCDGFSCVTGARCNPQGVCENPCGFRGEACCRDGTGVGHCYDGSTCVTQPPPAHCQ